MVLGTPLSSNQGFVQACRRIYSSKVISCQFASVPVESLTAISEKEMKFIITTCLFSQSQKPRGAPNVAEFLENNEILVTPSTLVDVELGIARIEDTDPGRAAGLRHWLSIERKKYQLAADQGEHFQKALARLLGCKAIQGLWTCEPAAKQFTFRQTLWVAATALASELPIATKSVTKYGQIDQHVPLPGIYDPVEMSWLTRGARPAKRIRLRRQVADTVIAVPATSITR